MYVECKGEGKPRLIVSKPACVIINKIHLLICLFLIYRPGRLEVQIETSLTDENGRLQILQIHTNKMKKSSFLAPDVNLQKLGICSLVGYAYDIYLFIYYMAEVLVDSVLSYSFQSYY